MPEHRVGADRVTEVQSLVNDAAYRTTRALKVGMQAVRYASGASQAECIERVVAVLERHLADDLPPQAAADWAAVRIFVQRHPVGQRRTYDGVGVIPIIQAD